MKALSFLQKASFVSLLAFGSGDTWANLIAVLISLTVLIITTLLCAGRA